MIGRTKPQGHKEVVNRCGFLKRRALPHENDIARHVIDAAFHLHKELGPGLLESVYEVILAHELKKRGFTVERQVSVPIRYEALLFEEGFRVDLIVADKVLVELKSVEALSPV
jgi:GxxExxY protein